MARKGVAEGRKTAIPFGPFLAFGGIVAPVRRRRDRRLVPRHVRVADRSAHGVSTPQVAQTAMPISQATGAPESSSAPRLSVPSPPSPSTHESRQPPSHRPARRRSRRAPRRAASGRIAPRASAPTWCSGALALCVAMLAGYVLATTRSSRRRRDLDAVPHRREATVAAKAAAAQALRRLRGDGQDPGRDRHAASPPPASTGSRRCATCPAPCPSDVKLQSAHRRHGPAGRPAAARRSAARLDLRPGDHASPAAPRASRRRPADVAPARRRRRDPRRRSPSPSRSANRCGHRRRAARRPAAARTRRASPSSCSSSAPPRWRPWRPPQANAATASTVPVPKAVSGSSGRRARRLRPVGRRRAQRRRQPASAATTRLAHPDHRSRPRDPLAEDPDPGGRRVSPRSPPSTSSSSSPKRERGGDARRQDRGQAGRSSSSRRRCSPPTRTRSRRYKTNYTTVARLGKAVPADDDVRSLLVQLTTPPPSEGRLPRDQRRQRRSAAREATTTATEPARSRARHRAGRQRRLLGDAVQLRLRGHVLPACPTSSRLERLRDGAEQAAST